MFFQIIIALFIGIVLGIITGILDGVLYRKANSQVDTDSKKPSVVFIGGAIGFLLVIITNVCLYIFRPNWQYLMTFDYILKTVVMYLFYIIFAELFWIQIANGKKKEA